MILVPFQQIGLFFHHPQPKAVSWQYYPEFRGDIDKRPAAGHLKPELFSVMLHKFILGTSV
jgi:hypothetical protein